ncbi:DUF4349 domain-containing protein [[Phormidium] sp. ETS-05]|uniref:DUF4349 domain-containing protein n=1 Tax=[Phormidium] sp. ETS-05 TaxID=222819 RepID=UPI0018EF0310|nr:DUF4349 domain-containing protein [[Phormidium] sp. ETS-05]
MTKLKNMSSQNLVNPNHHQPSTSHRRNLITLTLLLLAPIVLPSCSYVQKATNMSQGRENAVISPPGIAPSMPATQAELMPPNGSPMALVNTDIPRAQPQLIKRAELSVKVDSIDDSIQAISEVIKQAQADLISFQDRKPPTASLSHSVSMEIRVPQERLEATVNALANLGTVLHRSLNAEDVSDQLVDNDARLRNLRRQEELVLRIMDRSGSVKDMMDAAQQLGQIREAIERLDAQVKYLQQQVTYSTISLELEAAPTEEAQPEIPLETQLKETWNGALDSVTDFSITLLKLSIYLLVYSPYLLVALAFIFISYKLLAKPKIQDTKPAPAQHKQDTPPTPIAEDPPAPVANQEMANATASRTNGVVLNGEIPPLKEADLPSLQEPVGTTRK